MDDLRGLSKQALVERYDPLVHSIAHQIKNRLPITIELEELVSNGRLGLLQAADRFDPKLGVSFKTFAYYRIKGAMYDGLRKMEAITRRKDPRLKFDEAATQLLAAEAMRIPTEPRNPNLQEDIREVHELISSLVPIYFLANDAMDRLPHAKPTSAEERAAFAQERASLRRALEQLPKNERGLLEKYYYEDLTLEEAAAQIGVSKSWASRLHARALAKLKSTLKGPMK